ncbi:MAG: hypothetical protein GY943_32395 [Chloroflexi bacterium]|nr:hypothetical protein [Chloroflexota bacterium]
MFDFASLLFFMVCILLFVGAVFDVNWIMKFMKADRRYGRGFARVSAGIFGFLGTVMMIIILIQ